MRSIWSNQKGMALITVLLTVVIVIMLATMVMMMMVNELKGNNKTEELAKARYGIEGLIEEERANIYNILSVEATSSYNNYVREVMFQEQNPTRCEYNQDKLVISYEDISAEDETPLFVLYDIAFQDEPKKIIVTCTSSTLSITATLQIPQSIESASDVNVEYISIERSE